MIRFALLLLFCWSLSTTAQAQRNIRVGIVAYEDFESELTHYQQFFSDLTKRDPSVTFDLAVGSYSEVLHWTERQLVDLAILTPGVFASIMPDDSAPSICRYVASVELPPAQSPLSPEIRQSGKQFFGSYRSVCVVAKGSSIRDADDLRRAAASDAIEFLFVHPNSLSGYIGPLHALRQLDIEPQESQLQFTYSHTQSLRRLEQETSSEKTHVAFVWDDVEADADLINGLRRIEFPELDALELPRNVIVASSGFDFDERLRQLIVGSESDRYRFSALSDWREKFRNVRSWLEEADALALGPEKLSLDEVAQSLLQYARSQPQPPRLALVLSGGGAKCSYQVGAVAALEERLEELRRESGDESLDIQLVVGTSGGAINSVPVAMGISKTQAGRDGFATTWRSLDQRDIVRLPRLMRINMGVWFAALQTAIVIWLVRRYVPDLKRRGEAFAATYTLLAAVEVCLGYFPINPWSMLGQNHVLHHLWLWLSFGVRASAWALLGIGIASMIWERIRARHGDHLEIPKWLTNALLAGAVFGLPALQLITLLFLQATISTGAGMQSSLAQKFPTLINQHLKELNETPLANDPGASEAETLKQVSGEVIKRELLQRDLVLTGSCLSQTSDQLPSDLYFYAPIDRASEPPPFGPRGISLVDHPEILLDVVMGSGSIFPVFPGRVIDGIPQADELIELVDGGFAHNSPVEAAVLWGATHIILIEAKPRQRNERGNFVLNATSAFRHLHSQAQLLDTRSRGRVTIYTVAPNPPHMCVLDFAENLIDDSIQRGLREVGDGRRSFYRELGEPVFVSVQETDAEIP